jgi:hypothetical protein
MLRRIAFPMAQSRTMDALYSSVEYPRWWVGMVQSSLVGSAMNRPRAYPYPALIDKTRLLIGVVNAMNKIESIGRTTGQGLIMGPWCQLSCGLSGIGIVPMLPWTMLAYLITSAPHMR